MKHFCIYASSIVDIQLEMHLCVFHFAHIKLENSFKNLVIPYLLIESIKKKQARHILYLHNCWPEFSKLF